jgi:hypothetical protein
MFLHVRPRAAKSGAVLSIRTVGWAVGLTFVFSAIPGVLCAQSVVVRHSVVADVAPVVVVRDSGWTRLSDSLPHFSWTAEIRTNAVTSVQIMGPRGQDPVVHARSGQGAWVQLRPDAWNSITLAQPGQRRVTVEVRDVVGEPPPLRVIAR